MTLSCSFVALPAASLDIFWMAAYAHKRHVHKQAAAAWPRPLEHDDDTSYVLLYDSRLHRTSDPGAPANANRHQEQVEARDSATEFQLYDSRLLIRESQSTQIAGSQNNSPAASANEPAQGGEPAGWLVRETQLVLPAARLDDAAR